VSRAVAGALLRERPPDPWHGWVRHAPARWPGPRGPWIDLAAGALGESAGGPELLAALEGPRLEDLLYLPPVPPELAVARDRLAARHAARGTPVLVQLLPGDPPPSVPSAGIVVVWDLLAVALGDRGAVALDGVGGAGALWPLAPGLADETRLEAVASSVAAAGLAALLGVPVELSGRDRRDLGESMSEERYLRLFHGDAPSAAPLARAAARHGLLPLLPRPLPRPPLRGAGNLRAAELLASCAELSLLLGEPESRAQALLRAARFAEREAHDLAALARDGNLGVLPWLDGEARELVAEVAAGGEPRLWRQLLEALQ